ncbi:unnamed protein product, partial [Rotaria sordida]
VTLDSFAMDPRFTDEAKVFAQLFTSLQSSSNALTPESLRTFFEDLCAKANEKLIGTFNGNLQEKHVMTNSADIPINVYTPTNVNKDKLVVYFHGGGVDRTAKVGVAGDSAGAMISTSVCQTVKDIDFQILVYGWYDFTCATPSFKEFTNQQYFVKPELVDWTIKNVFNDGFDINDSRISVFRNTSLEKLPPTLLIVAELDPIRDDSYTYKELLDKAGVKNKLVLIKGVLHRFFPLPGVYPKACAQAIAAIREFMSSIS